MMSETVNGGLKPIIIIPGPCAKKNMHISKRLDALGQCKVVK